MKRRTHVRLIVLLILASVAGLSMVVGWYCPSCYSAVTGRKYATTIPELRNEEGIGEVSAGLNHSQVIKERVNTLRQRCEQLQTNGTYRRKEKFELDHLVVDDKYKLIYCFIPKVACTNIKKVFLLLTGKLNVTDPAQISHHQVHFPYKKKLRLLDMYKKPEVEHRLANYKKIIFVRDPFERLLSAYKDKFLSDKEYGREILRGVRTNSAQASLSSAKDFTFQEFTKFLIHQRESLKGFNEHWATFQDLCSPCEVGYDFIGSYETLDNDMDTLLSEIGVSDTIRFPKRGETYTHAKTNDVKSESYKEIGSDNIRKLYNIYFNDFYLFGYEPKLRP